MIIIIDGSLDLYYIRTEHKCIYYGLYGATLKKYLGSTLSTVHYSFGQWYTTVHVTVTG